MYPVLLAFAGVLMLASAAAIVVLGWLLFRSRGAPLYVLLIASLGVLTLYLNSHRRFAQPIAWFIFDTATPAVLALPLLAAAWLELGSGRLWLSIGRANRLQPQRPANEKSEETPAAAGVRGRADPSTSTIGDVRVSGEREVFSHSAPGDANSMHEMA